MTYEDIRDAVFTELERRDERRLTTRFPADRVTSLAANPEAMAIAIDDIETIGRYALYFLGILGFLVWLMLMGGRRDN